MTNEDFSIDLETLGTRYDAAILSISVQQFDRHTGKLGATFYREIELRSAIKSGSITADTLHWWLHQDAKARRVFGKDNKIVLAEALMSLCDWMRGFALTPHVWGNGATFDISILEYAYDHGAVGAKEPWGHTNIRDLRTLREVAEATGWRNDVKDVGTRHNALDDATCQAHLIISLWKHLTAGKTVKAAPLPPPPIKDDGDDL